VVRRTALHILSQVKDAQKVIGYALDGALRVSGTKSPINHVITKRAMHGIVVLQNAPRIPIQVRNAPMAMANGFVEGIILNVEGTTIM
jgi:hypothetical protein